MARKLNYALFVDLVTTGFNKGATKLNSMFASIRSNALALAGTLAGGVGLAEFGSKVIQTAKDMESLRTTLKNVSNSNKDYADSLKFLNRLANENKVSIQSLLGSYSKYKASADAAGLSTKEVNNIFEQFTRQSAKFNLSADQTNGVMLALSQMMSKGTIQAEELRGQLGERMPGALNLFAKAMGVSTLELNKLMADGKLLSKDVLPKVAEELARINEGFKVSSTINTASNEIGNTIANAVNSDSITKPIVKALEGVNAALKAFFKNLTTILIGSLGFISVRVSKSIGKNFKNINKQIKKDLETIGRLSLYKKKDNELLTTRGAELGGSGSKYTGKGLESNESLKKRLDEEVKYLSAIKNRTKEQENYLNTSEQQLSRVNRLIKNEQTLSKLLDDNTKKRSRLYKGLTDNTSVYLGLLTREKQLKNTGVSLDDQRLKDINKYKEILDNVLTVEEKTFLTRATGTRVVDKMNRGLARSLDFTKQIGKSALGFLKANIWEIGITAFLVGLQKAIGYLTEIKKITKDINKQYSDIIDDRNKAASLSTESRNNSRTISVYIKEIEDKGERVNLKRITDALGVEFDKINEIQDNKELADILTKILKATEDTEEKYSRERMNLAAIDDANLLRENAEEQRKDLKGGGFGRDKQLEELDTRIANFNSQILTLENSSTQASLAYQDSVKYLENLKKAYITATEEINDVQVEYGKDRTELDNQYNNGTLTYTELQDAVYQLNKKYAEELGKLDTIGDDVSGFFDALKMEMGTYEGDLDRRDIVSNYNADKFNLDNQKENKILDNDEYDNAVYELNKSTAEVIGGLGWLDEELKNFLDSLLKDISKVENKKEIDKSVISDYNTEKGKLDRQKERGVIDNDEYSDALFQLDESTSKVVGGLEELDEELKDFLNSLKSNIKEYNKRQDEKAWKEYGSFKDTGINLSLDDIEAAVNTNDLSKLESALDFNNDKAERLIESMKELGKVGSEELDKIAQNSVEIKDAINAIELKGLLEQLNGLKGLGFDGLKFDMITSYIDGVDNFINSLDQLKSSWESMNETLADSDASGWEKFMSIWDNISTILNTLVSTMQTINTIMQVQQAISSVTAGIKNKETKATLGSAAAKVIEAMASKKNAVAAGTEAAATGASAATKGANAVAGIPIVGPVLAIAAAVGIAAAIASSIKSTRSAAKFAQGGIVPGGSFVGDKVPAYLNSGEMVLNQTQQSKLFSMLNSGVTGTALNSSNGPISMKISGTSLYGVQKNIDKRNKRFRRK